MLMISRGLQEVAISMRTSVGRPEREEFANPLDDDGMTEKLSVSDIVVEDGWGAGSKEPTSRVLK
jgi:hypothetical protein